MERIIEFFSTTQWDFPAVVAGIFGAWILVVLVRWHTEDSRFDLRHILIDGGTNRVSLHKLGQFVALIVSTIVLWYEMLHARLTEWLFAGYMFTWTGALLAKRWIDRPQPGGQQSDTPPSEPVTEERK